jgi:hypothetical protein
MIIINYCGQIKPGGPSNRVELVEVLIEHGADVNALVR